MWVGRRVGVEREKEREAFLSSFGSGVAHQRPKAKKTLTIKTAASCLVARKTGARFHRGQTQRPD
jgi:hypothetical protein